MSAKGIWSSWNHRGRISAAGVKERAWTSHLRSNCPSLSNDQAGLCEEPDVLLGSVLPAVSLCHFVEEEQGSELGASAVPASRTWTWLPLARGGGEKGRAPRLTIALHGRPLDTVCAENVYVHQLRLAHELKHDVSHLVKCFHSQTALLLQLPAGGAGDTYSKAVGRAEQQGHHGHTHTSRPGGTLQSL